MKRLHQVFQHDASDGASVHWQMLKEQVKKKMGLEPFAQVDTPKDPGFCYLNSIQRMDRFEILEGEAPYTVTTEWAADAVSHLPKGAGPIEIDVAGFMLDPRLDLGVLIGGMGCGKSTTLRQMIDWLKPTIRVQYINCDKAAVDLHHPPPAMELLVTALSPLALNLVNTEAEFGPCWDWALEQYGMLDASDEHSSVNVLEPAVEALTREYGAQWQRNDDQAVEFRRKHLHQQVCTSVERKFQYIAMRLDYYLTVIRHDERHRLCIVLDNIDPLPPLLQRELLLCASRLQLNARCKLILSMRPLTYSLTYEQRANRTVKVLQHIGPPALALIEDRVKRLIEAPDIPGLKLRVQAEDSVERDLTQQDFKAWVRQVFEDIRASRTPGGSRSQEPSAFEFIEGLCNNSLRSALLVAEKIFGSRNLPMVLPDDPPSDGTHTTILKNHEIVRAVLLGRHPHFVSELTRVTDNIFDLGDATVCHSPTCKYRILRELASAPGRGILMLDELLERLNRFGYDERTLLEAVNGVISQVKRLAWSDMAVAYQTLHEPPHSRLSISRAGRFYVDHAIFSLEYVQEVHVDVLLPEHVAGSAYNHRGFSDRINSLYRFMRYLHEVDRHEVQLALADVGSRRRYFDTYGATLFTCEMARALARQITKIGASILRRRTDEKSRYVIEGALARWETFDRVLATEDQAIIDLLQPMATHGHV